MTFDCTKCGACCVNLTRMTRDEQKQFISEGGVEAPWIPLTAAERRRLPAAAKKLTVLNRPWVDGHAICTKLNADSDRVCAMLDGSVGVEVRCAVYDKRPSLCRDFAPGSRGCLEARKENLTDPVR